MQQISIPEIALVVEHIAVELNKVPMIVGQFGVGKTAGINQAGKKLDAFVAPVLLGQYDTVDMKGTPWAEVLEHDFDNVSEKKKFTVWHPASTLPVVGNPLFPDDKIIILFLDELTSATVPVMGVCYQLVQERRVGEHILKPNVRIVCAGNREEDKGIVNRMPLPLCNRMVWFEAGVDVDAWCDHAISQGWDPLLTAFHKFRSRDKGTSMLCNWNPSKPEKVVATPRTWETVAHLMANSTMPSRIKHAAIAGSVGDGPAADLQGFAANWETIQKIMPNILKAPETTAIPEETSLQYVVAVAISGSMTSKNAKPYHTYLCRMEPEFPVLAWQLAVKRDPQMFASPEFLDFSKRYKVIFS